MQNRPEQSRVWRSWGCAFVLVTGVAAGAAAQTNLFPASGKVLIGSNLVSPTRYAFPAVALEVRGQANPSSGPAFTARFTNSAGSGSGVIIQAGSDRPASPVEVLRLASFDGPAQFIFFNDGRSSGLSDQRLKTDIHPVEDALSRLDGVRGVRFKWINNATPQIGLIAQEVESAFPELVQEIEGRKGVDYQRFTAVLVEAIRELKLEVEQLKRDNQELARTLSARKNR